MQAQGSLRFATIAATILIAIVGSRPVRAQADIEVRLVAVAAPSTADSAAAPPVSLPTVVIGTDYFIELWTSDVEQPSTGVSSAYVDVLLPAAAMYVGPVVHSQLFSYFPSGALLNGRLDELGGSAAEVAGLAPSWARVASARMRAATVGTAAYTMAPSSTGVGARGRGAIPWANIALTGVTVTHEQDCNGNQVPDGREVSGAAVLVCSRTSNNVLAFDAPTGGYLRAHIPAGAGGLSYANGVLIDENGDIYVSSVLPSPGAVLKFSGLTRQLLLTMQGCGLDSPVGLALRGTNELLVGSYSSNSVVVFDRTTGACIDSSRVDPGSGGLTGTDAIHLLPDDTLLVCSQATNRVLRFNAASGAPLPFAAEGCGLDTPAGLALESAGTFLVSSLGTDDVLRFRISDGQCLGAIIQGIPGPEGLAWNVNGNLLVCCRLAGEVREFNPSTGEFLRALAGGGLDEPTFVTVGTIHADCNSNIIPDDCDIASGASADCDADGIPDSCQSPRLPEIVTPPASQLVCSGANVTMCVNASGAAPLRYQWYHNDAPIPSDTESCLTIVSAAADDQGAYWCAVTNSCGEATSPSATLTVLPGQLGTLYVDDDAPLGGDGHCWLRAYRFLQDALYTAASDPSVHEIRVAGGLYKPDRDEGGHVVSGSRFATFALRDALAIRGGYRGLAAGGDPDDRDAAAFESQLSGDLASDDGVDFANNDENSFRVVTCNNVTLSAELDGVTVSAANANSSGSLTGGGIWISGGEPTISHCVIRGNAANYGAGVSVTSAAPRVSDCWIDGNEATYDGGGVRCVAGGGQWTNCTFSSNHAGGYGGAMRNEQSVPVLTACAFVENVAQMGGAAHNVSSQPVFSACRFERNTADWDGGGVYNNASSSTLQDCDFLENVADGSSGGGLYNISSAPVIVRCRFVRNVADPHPGGNGGSGGGIANAIGANVVVIGCLFAENETSNVGGGFSSGAPPGATSNSLLVNCAFTGNRAAIDGGGIFLGRSQTRIVNSTIGQNTTSSGLTAGIRYHRWPDDTGTMTISNCVLWGNVAGGHSDQLAQLGDATGIDVHASCVQGWTGSLGGVGNFGVDPQFVDPAGPDDIPGTIDDDLRLREGSPCVDAGDPAAIPPDVADLDHDGDTTEPTPLDLDGNPRIVDDCGSLDAAGGLAVDIGAYERSVDCRPRIASHPLSQSVETGNTVQLTVIAWCGNGFSYQWRRNGSSLADDSHFAGTTSPTLTIHGVAASDTGTFDVVVQNACGATISRPALLSAHFADCNNNGIPDELDIQGSPAPDLATWTPAGSMSTPRRYLTATLLADGRVLIVGFTYGNAEVFNPATGASTLAFGMHAPHTAGQTATLLNDGRVLVVGGYNSGRVADLFDPATSTFSQVGNTVVPHIYHTATLLNDGRVLIAGGRDSSGGWTQTTAEIYDPATGQFSLTGSLAHDRNGAVSARLPNGEVLVVGGSRTTSPGNGVPIASVEIYDPVIGAFREIAPLHYPRIADHAIALADDRVLIIGDLTRATCELFDPATESFLETPPMSVRRSSSSAAQLEDGRVLIAGGFIAAGPVVTDTAELYDPSAGQFVATTSLPEPRMQAASVRLADGRVLVLGGYSGSGSDLASALFYNLPASNDCDNNGVPDECDLHSWQAFDASAADVDHDGNPADLRGFAGAVFDGRYMYFVPHYNSVDYNGEVLRHDTLGRFDDPTTWEAFDPVADHPLQGYWNACFDGRYVYFSPFYSHDNVPHGEVLRYDTTGAFQSNASWEAYDPGANGRGVDPRGYTGCVFDGRYVYFVPYLNGTGYHCEVLRLDTTREFTDAVSWDTFNPREYGVGDSRGGYEPGGFVGASFDGRYVYFSPFARGDLQNTSPNGQVLRYDSHSGFFDPQSWQTHTSLPSGEPGSDPRGYGGAIFDGRFVYFAPLFNGSSFHGEVLRCDTFGSFESDSTWTTFNPAGNGVGTNSRGYVGGTFDGRFVYFSPDRRDGVAHGEVLRCDTLRNFSHDSTWKTHDAADLDDVHVPGDPDGYWGAAFDGRYVYFSPWHDGSNYNSLVLRYDTGGPFTRIDRNGNGTLDRCECLGDLNEDGVVSVQDLANLLSSFGTVDGAIPEDGDIDGDGDVDIQDVAFLLANFGMTCS